MENLANNTVASELGLESTAVNSATIETPVAVVASVVSTEPAAVAIEESVEALVDTAVAEEAPVQETEEAAEEVVVPTAAEILAAKCDQVEAAEYVGSEDTIASINAAIRGTIGEEGGAFAKAFGFKHYNTIYKFLKKDADFSLATLIDIAKQAGYKLDIVATKIDEEIEGLSDANQSLIDTIATVINAELLEKFTSTKAGAKAELSAEKKAEKLAEKKAKDDAKKEAKEAAKIERDRLAKEKKDAKTAASIAAKAAARAEKDAAAAAAPVAITPELAINLDAPVALAEAVAASESLVAETGEPSIVKATVETADFVEDDLVTTTVATDGLVVPEITSL